MIDIIKEVNRLSGFNPMGDLISGQPTMLVDSDTVTAYTGSGEVLGLAIDDTKVFVLANVPTIMAQSSTTRILMDRPSGDLTPQSLFFSEINRGGKVSVAVDGGVFGLFDDGRGSPFADAGITGSYMVNAPVYAYQGQIWPAGQTGAPKVGICLKTPDADGILVIKSLI